MTTLPTTDANRQAVYTGRTTSWPMVAATCAGALLFALVSKDSISTWSDPIFLIPLVLIAIGVFANWCGTLVEYPVHEDRFRPVLRALGRPHDDASVAELVAAFQEAEQHPDAVESDRRCDLSAENHRATKLLICELAGIDRELAVAIERTFGDFATYPTYPEVVDVIKMLAIDGVTVAIVSDFHVRSTTAPRLARVEQPHLRLRSVVRGRNHEARPRHVPRCVEGGRRRTRAVPDGGRQSETRHRRSSARHRNSDSSASA